MIIQIKWCYNKDVLFKYHVFYYFIISSFEFHLSGPIKLLTNLLKMSLSYSNHRCIGFSSSELAEGLTQIAVNDNNKKMVIRWDYYLVLIVYCSPKMQTGKERSTSFASKCNASNAYKTIT